MRRKALLLNRLCCFVSAKFPLDFAYAFPSTDYRACYKKFADDFLVEENLGFKPSASGEHLFLFVEKKHLSTDQLVLELARALKISKRQVAYSGLKDKLAVTRQWLSVPMPIKQQLPELGGQHWQVLQMSRHNKKLKRAAHSSNGFVIRLRHRQCRQADIQKRLECLAKTGFPNYFGEQRFGFKGDNIDKAQQLFDGRLKCKAFQRSLYYSAARSFLFNHYLSARVVDGNWNKAIAGDNFNLDGSNGFFGPEPKLNDELQQRVDAFDIHPVAALHGKPDSRLSEQAKHYQQAVLNHYPDLAQGIENAGLKTAYRPLRAYPKALEWEFFEDYCVLSFQLRSGSYATALLRELLAHA